MTYRRSWGIFAVVPRYVVIGAARWLSLLEKYSEEKSRALLASTPEYADIRSSTYEECLDWLRSVGLVPVSGEPGRRLEAFFQLAIGDSLAPWVTEGESVIPSAEYLPEIARQVGDVLSLSPAEVWAIGQGLAQRADLARRTEIGLAGELALSEYLLTQGFDVDRVSARSDAHGFDLAVRTPGLEKHIEVKSTTSLARLRLFLSRHEHEVALQDANWILVIALLGSEDLSLMRVGELSRAHLPQLVPADQHSLGRWETCRLEPPGEAVAPGIPTLGLADIPSSTEGRPLWWPTRQQTS